MTAENLVFASFAVLPGLFALGLWRFARWMRRRGGWSRWSWPRLVAGNALLLGVLVSLLLLAGESYYRFVHDTTDSFGLTKTHERWIERYYHENNTGVRDNVDYDDFLAAGKLRRLTFLGDSFTAAHGVKDVEQRFVNIVRRERSNWEVHSIARNGNDTRHQLDALVSMLRIPQGDGRDLRLSLDPSGRIVTGVDPMQRRILGRDAMGQVVLREPPSEEGPGRLIRVPDSDHRIYQGYQLDTVVWVYCLNDIVDIVPEWGEILDRIYRESQPGWLGRHSYLLNTWHYRLFAARDPDVAEYFRFTAEAYRAESPVWQRQVARLETLRTLVETGGGQLLVVTFPYLDQLGGEYEHRHAHELLDQFWNSIGVPHLDLLSIYDGLEPERLTVNARDPHPNERAHGMAAEAIIRFVEANPPEAFR